MELLENERGARLRFVATPRVELESDALRVGGHRMRFSSGTQQSRETSVEVLFDNAMSTATIRSPSGGFALELRHPRRGRHFYMRRAPGAAPP